MALSCATCAVFLLRPSRLPPRGCRLAVGNDGQAALARVVAALFVVHRALWNQDAPEIQRSTANGFPVDLLEVK